MAWEAVGRLCRQELTAVSVAASDILRLPPFPKRLSPSPTPSANLWPTFHRRARDTSLCHTGAGRPTPTATTRSLTAGTRHPISPSALALFLRRAVPTCTVPATHSTWFSPSRWGKIGQSTTRPQSTPGRPGVRRDSSTRLLQTPRASASSAARHPRWRPVRRRRMESPTIAPLHALEP